MNDPMNMPTANVEVVTVVAGEVIDPKTEHDSAKMSDSTIVLESKFNVIMAALGITIFALALASTVLLAINRNKN